VSVSDYDSLKYGASAKTKQKKLAKQQGWYSEIIRFRNSTTFGFGYICFRRNTFLLCAFENNHNWLYLNHLKAKGDSGSPNAASSKCCTHNPNPNRICLRSNKAQSLWRKDAESTPPNSEMRLALAHRMPGPTSSLVVDDGKWSHRRRFEQSPGDGARATAAKSALSLTPMRATTTCSPPHRSLCNFCG
jgi:hypothetical protein